MPPRANRKVCAILISALFATSLVILGTRAKQRGTNHFSPSATLSGPFTALFTFRAPSAFFTPTATISLTDDNSTYFAARPAAFGPLLPHRGLSGQLWIGTGFLDKVESSPVASTEGELGCEDAPGWMHREWSTHSASWSSRLGAEASDMTGISGKVALLSRGGCSFSEKVKWAQRRGATAVIIGDNIVGGPLVRMYAKGDASNISIPSLFTSHTTAHLLSSLVPIDTGKSYTATGISHKLHPSSIASLDDLETTEKPPAAMWSRELARKLGYQRSSRNHAAVLNRPGWPKSKGRHNKRDGESLFAWRGDQPFNPHLHGPSSLHHQGLWVTLTPTNMSTSPFLNTLFVLVVSPLITLAIVYTMLLLRSRIRRRRWRAPKSIVERLPVRVYHTLSASNSSSSSTVAQTQATPLLAEAEPSGSTTSASHYGSCESAPNETEKPDTGLAAWKKKYGGRQVECVVCLEEYEDGVSKVMSLPCGHEFHVDCITPWLTTRRRTCPICKGDVVRSLIHDDATGASTDQVDGLSYEDVQVQAAETVNNSPSAAMPVPEMPTEMIDSTHDVERGGHGHSAGSSSWYSNIQRRIDSYFHSIPSRSSSPLPPSPPPTQPQQ